MNGALAESRAARWLVRSASILVGAAALTACSASLDERCDLQCAIADQRFYASTWLTVNPSSVTVDPGVEATAKVSVGSDETLAINVDSGVRQLAGLTVVPPTPGVTLTPSTEPCDMPALGSIVRPVCRTWRVAVSAEAIAAGTRSVTLSAVWTVGDGGSNQDPGRAIERVEQFGISLPAAPPPPDFQLAVAQTGTFHVPRITLPISIARTNGFAETVALTFDALGSGIEGAFVVDPAAPDRPDLVIDLPARYAGGGLVPLRVTATAADGKVRVRDFVQRIDPLLVMSIAPNTAVLDPTAPPLDIDVVLNFGPSAATALGRIELSVPTPPEGIAVQFLPDATPVAAGPLPYTLHRTLRLTSDGRQGGEGTIQIRATAIDVAPDRAVPPQRPFFETTLTLRVAAAMQWSYVGQGLSHELTRTDTVGAALQPNDHPAVAWLEGRPGIRKVFLRRFDGATFNASPPGAGNGLSAPIGDIVEASFALTRTDVAQVAFTYGDGAGLGVGSAGPAAAAWSTVAPIGSGAGLRRTPRIAAGAGDALTLSYVLQGNPPATTSRLLVRRSLGGGAFDPMPGPQADGAINQDDEGRVLDGTTALALRADGTPLLAWIEQPGDPASPPVLWLRAHSGAGWLASLRVQAPGRPRLEPSSVQIVVERAGTVVVSWLEGSPARLMLARVDLASQSVTPLPQAGNGDGALNIAASQPARDVTLGLDAGGRIVVAWTEGGLKPELWAKRLDAGGWSLLGSSIDAQGRALKSPRFVGDSNGRLYIAYTSLYGDRDLGSIVFDSDISVVRWTP